MIRENQIGKAAGFVKEAPEADNVWNLCQRFFHTPGRWSAENRIRFVEEQQLNRRTLRTQDTCRHFLNGCSLLGTVRCCDLRRKRYSTRLPDTSGDGIQRVDRERLKHSV